MKKLITIALIAVSSAGAFAAQYDTTLPVDPPHAVAHKFPAGDRPGDSYKWAYHPYRGWGYYSYLNSHWIFAGDNK